MGTHDVDRVASKLKKGPKVKGPIKGGRFQRQVKKTQVLRNEAAYEAAVEQAFQNELSGAIFVRDGEQTADLKQAEILRSVDLGTAEKVFDLNLSLGPYSVDVSLDGQYGLIGGRKGDVALISMMTNRPVFQRNVLETVRCVKFCFNEHFWACAQKKYISIYDKQGVELHCFKNELGALALDYLPFHFLLTSVGEFGILRYRDIATGQFAAVHKTGRGACSVMRHNPYNGVVNLGHTGGTVSLWTPTIVKPVVEFFAHKGGLTALCPFREYYLATAGNDGFWKVWDIRNANRSLNETKYFGMPPVTMDVSHTGLLAIGFGPHTQIWKDANLPSRKSGQQLYLLDRNKNGQVAHSVKFRPFEDVLFVGHSIGVKTLLVPGAGMATPDSLTDNPYASSREKSARLVRRLIDKLPIDSIILGGIDSSQA